MYIKIAAGLLLLAITVAIVEASSKNSKSKDSHSRDSRSKAKGPGNDRSNSKSNSKSKSKDNDFCKSVIPTDIIFNTNYNRCKGNNPLPICTCGPSAEISQIQIYSSVTKKNTTIQFCSGCTGIHVPLDSSSTCGNVPTMFRSTFNSLCSTLFPKCKKTVTFYRCECSGGTTSKLGSVTTAKVPATTAQVPVSTAKAPATIVNLPTTVAVVNPSLPTRRSTPVFAYTLASITDAPPDF